MSEEKNSNDFNFKTAKTKNTKKEKKVIGSGRVIFVSFITTLIVLFLVFFLGLMLYERTSVFYRLERKLIDRISVNINNKITDPNVKQPIQESQKNLDFASFNQATIAVAKNTIPSVVAIEIEYDVATMFSTGKTSAKGSGIIFSEDGYILTNNHVVNPKKTSSFFEVSEANKITVTLSNEEKVEAKIIGKDEQTDLAIIKIEKNNLPAIKLGNSDNLQIGEFVMAVGSPLGLDNSVTLGIVSGLNRKIEAGSSAFNAIQTSATINSGNSGGPLVNMNGEVVGITTLKAAGDGVEGLGFAIPINQAKNIAEQLKINKKVDRPELGIEGFNISPEMQKQLDLPKGILVKNIKKDSAAEKAGILPSDIIVKFNKKNVESFADINLIKDSLKSGDKVEIELIRSGQTKSVNIVLP